MSILVGNPFLLNTTAATGYQVSRSLRFNSADSAYLSRTPASAGNRKTWTWSAWVKRSALSSSAQYALFSTNGTSDSTFSYITFFNDTIAVTAYTLNYLVTSAVYRDASAWMHIVVALDTTQATASNRLKLYVNGSEVTAFSTDNRSSISQNSDLGINSAISHAIGRQDISGVNYFSGYLANIEFVDGSQLTPSSFAETDSTTSQWVPKLFSGSYGTNGFKLTFADNSNNTASTLGADTSGNGNNWTPNNLSIASGSGNDSLTDSPTSYGTDTGAGGSVRGNYCTWNPLNLSRAGDGITTTNTLSNGNLDATFRNAACLGTIGINSGKWYWETTLTSAPTSTQTVVVGVASGSYNVGGAYPRYIGSDAISWGYVGFDGKVYNNGVGSTYGAGCTSGDVIGVALDCDNGKLFFSKNGVWQNSGNPSTGANPASSALTAGPYFPAVSDGGGPTEITCTFNFGARAFSYTAPSGFKALCDTNLPAPVVAKPNTVFDVIRYTGNGSTQTIPNVNTVPTTLGFSPDLVWIKNRGAAVSHYIQDVVRGTYAYLSSNSTGSENNLSGADWFSSFDSSGFTVKYSSTGYGASAGWNESSTAYVGWCWDAGSSTVTNTQGSITTSVRANTSAGFSVATWTGTGSGSVSVGHGCGGVPQFFIVKDRSLARNWLVYHVSMGATRGMALNSTNGQSGTDAGFWNNTSPTSTVATIGTYGNESSNYVGYFWTPVSGYSSFGSYTGNGSTDGPFVYTGFRPRWILIKNASAGSTNWVLQDTARSTKNIATEYLLPDMSVAEGNADLMDILSNGFKQRNTFASNNTSGATYIYAAFAENPFQYARAR